MMCFGELLLAYCCISSEILGHFGPQVQNDLFVWIFILGFNEWLVVTDMRVVLCNFGLS